MLTVAGLVVACDSGGGMEEPSPAPGPNQEPSATISSPAEGDTLNEGSPTTFSGSASDSEEGTLTGDALVWESDVVGRLGTGQEITTDVLSPGLHAIVLTVTDSAGATARDTVSVRVQQKPSVSIASPTGGEEFARSESIAFEGSAEDPEEGPLSGDALAWRSSADEEFGNGAQVTTGTLSPDRHTIILVATDRLGATGRDSVTIAVNGPPTASISSPESESAINEGNALALEGTGTDPVDGQLSGPDLEWFSDVDGSLDTGQSLSVANLSPGPHTIVLEATDSDGNAASDSARIVVESPGFDIRLRFLSDFTSSQKTTIRDALAPWTEALEGDLEAAFPPSDAAEECLIGNRGVDDLVLAIREAPIDGSGGTLAQAGPCLTRSDAQGNFTTSISGVVTIDEADLENPDLDQIVTHEVGHALGIGIGPIEGWGTNVTGLNTADPLHSGPNTTDAFDQLESEAYLSEGVPVANTGGQGTRGAHWREANFDTELMTGIINSGIDMPISRVTLASLEDIGYAVDLSAADPFSLPMPQTALWLAEADATLSRPASSDENFGLPEGTRLDSALVAGSNNDGLWSSDPEGEIFSGLVRFGVPSSLPMGVAVESAEIRLIVADRNAETMGHNVGIFPVTESWSEGSVTWANRPGTGDLAEAFDFQSCSQCLQDLTSLATDWLTGDAPKYGVAFRAPDAATDPTFSIGFYSRHSESPLLRPLVVVSAHTTTTALTGRERRRSSEEKISLGNDVRSGPIYGIGSRGKVIGSARLR